MANNRDLNFIIGALDRSEKAWAKVARNIDQLQRRLDRLDGKKVDVEVDVDTKEAAKQLGRFTGLVTTIGGGMIRFITSDARVAAAVIAGVFAALPAAAALAATGIVAGFGAGLAGLGLVGAAQTKKVKKQFADLKDDLGKQLREFSKPFVSTFGVIDKQIRRVFGSLGLEGIFKRLAPAVSRLVKNIGDGLVKFAPALRPLSDAFIELMDLLGPQIEAMFADLKVAFTDIADVVRDNKDTFAAIFTALIRAIPYVIGFIARLADAFAFMFRGGLVAFSAIADIVGSSVIPALRVLANAVLTVFGVIVSGAAKAFGWVPGVGPKLKKAAAEFPAFKESVLTALDEASAAAKDWSEASAKLAKELTLKADISDLEGKLEVAKRKLKDPTLTKAQKKAIRGDIEHLERKLAEARRKLRVLDPPTIKDIRGNIRDLHQKLESAKRQLRNPRLTKPQRKELRGKITDLKAKIREAKRAIASVRGKTVTLTARWSMQEFSAAAAIRGVGARAHGGPVLAGRSYLVGERGPEILNMGGRNGNVIPNNQISAAAEPGFLVAHINIDGREIRHVVRLEVSERDRDLKRTILAGPGGGR